MWITPRSSVLLSDAPALAAKALAQAAAQPCGGTTPVVIVACAADTSRAMHCGMACYPTDVAIALEHIALQATAEGRGTCWIGAFDQEAARQAVGAPDGAVVVQLVPPGYPAVRTRAKDRLPMAEIVFEEVWR